MSGFPATIEGTAGRVYRLDETGRVISTDHMADMYEDYLATVEAEIEAEWVMSYVMGGGRPEDAKAARWQARQWAAYRADADNF